MRSRSVRIVGVGAIILATFAACHVFASLDECANDEDCPDGLICSTDRGFCTKANASDSADDVIDATSDEHEAPADVGADVDSGADADADADAAPCDLGKPFGDPRIVPGFEGISVSSARLSNDERAVYFSTFSDGGTLDDIYAATRDAALAASFKVVGLLPIVNSRATEYWPSLTSDGNLLFFESSRSLTKVDGSYVQDVSRVWTATRVNNVSDFGEPYIQSLFVTDSGVEGAPFLHPGGGSVYFISLNRPGKGNLDIFVADIDIGIVTDVSNVDAVNTAFPEVAPVISRDDRALYFGRSDNLQTDVWVTRRTTPKGTFGTPSRIDELATAYTEYPAWVSDDECRIYFVSDRPITDGGLQDVHLWIAERLP